MEEEEKVKMEEETIPVANASNNVAVTVGNLELVILSRKNVDPRGVMA